MRLDLRGPVPTPERNPDYRALGVATEDGQAHAYAAASADCAAELLQHHSAPERVLTELSAVLASASWSLAFQHKHVEILTAMKDAQAKMPSQANEIWVSIIGELEARAPRGDR
ncbi:hypothetical protein [Streptomyces sp. NBC_01013]|uniref:hypothetical protein n=1 Tax=Streptomyces sp. NBC_01013 TaxID=2903718 RepID=UPI00386A75BA|nr:hypothetical protein OG538_00020 [Streptomyces sp. NBC_01013]WSV65587.1 hypothetical protein OG538_36400 [Streptomyces sp. NBC_01013]